MAVYCDLVAIDGAAGALSRRNGSPASPTAQVPAPARFTTRSAGRSWDWAPAGSRGHLIGGPKKGLGRTANVQRMRYTTCQNDSKERPHRPTTLSMRRTLRNAYFSFLLPFYLFARCTEEPNPVGPDASTMGPLQGGYPYRVQGSGVRKVISCHPCYRKPHAAGHPGAGHRATSFHRRACDDGLQEGSHNCSHSSPRPSRRTQP